MLSLVVTPTFLNLVVTENLSYTRSIHGMLSLVLLDISLNVKAAPHECVIRTGSTLGIGKS